MPDVDGLIVGSPVNLMGIPVGYVTKTKIINDDKRENLPACADEK